MRHEGVVRATARIQRAAPSSGHERASDFENYNEKSKPGFVHAIDDANTRNKDASELLMSMRGILRRLDSFEELQTRLMDA